jgi:hypothetical protein
MTIFVGNDDLAMSGVNGIAVVCWNGIGGIIVQVQEVTDEQTTVGKGSARTVGRV